MNRPPRSIGRRSGAVRSLAIAAPLALVACTGLLGSFEIEEGVDAGPVSGLDGSTMGDRDSQTNVDASSEAGTDGAATDAADASMPPGTCVAVGSPRTLAASAPTFSELRSYRISQDLIRVIGTVADTSMMYSFNPNTNTAPHVRDMAARVLDVEKLTSYLGVFVRPNGGSLLVLRRYSDFLNETGDQSILDTVSTTLGSDSTTGTFSSATSGNGFYFAWKQTALSANAYVAIPGSLSQVPIATRRLMGIIYPPAGIPEAAVMTVAPLATDDSTLVHFRTGGAWSVATFAIASRLLARPQPRNDELAIAFASNANSIRIGKINANGIYAFNLGMFGTELTFASAAGWPSGAVASYQWQGGDFLAIAPSLGGSGMTLLWFDADQARLVIKQTGVMSGRRVARAALSRVPGTRDLDLVWQDAGGSTSVDGATSAGLYAQTLRCD